MPFNLKLSINKQIEECQRKCNRNWNAFQACRPSSAHSKKDETKCRSHRDCHCNLAKFGNKGARWQCTTGTRIQCIQYWAEQQGITSWDCYSSCAAQSDKSDLPSTTSASSQFRTDLTSLLCGRRGLQCRPDWRLRVHQVRSTHVRCKLRTNWNIEYVLICLGNNWMKSQKITKFVCWKSEFGL